MIYKQEFILIFSNSHYGILSQFYWQWLLSSFNLNYIPSLSL